MSSSVVGPRRSSNALLKTKPGPKQGHSHGFVVCCPPLQLSESQRNHYIWEVCSANQWDAPKTAMPAAGTGRQKGPNFSLWQCLTTHGTTSFRSWMNGATKLCLIHHIHLTSRQPTTTASSISKTVCRQNASTTVPLLGIHTEETRTERDTCTPMFITAPFIRARPWRQPRCPSARWWIRKLWYIYTMEYYSAIKKNAFESVLMRWMKLWSLLYRVK